MNTRKPWKSENDEELQSPYKNLHFKGLSSETKKHLTREALTLGHAVLLARVGCQFSGAVTGT